MKYFTLDEMCYSTKANELKIKNIADPNIVNNIIWFVNNVLDPLREAWGAPLIVSSGFRCLELNKAVGGSRTSAHMQGLAADLKPQHGGDIPKFKRFCREYFKHHDFDQCINEPTWVHVGARINGSRNQFLLTRDMKTYKYWKQDEI